MEELDFKELLALFWKKKWIILLIILLITSIGMIYSFYFIEPKYESSTTLILGRINASSENGDILNDGEEITQSEININSNLVATYSELIKSKTLIQKVIDNLSLNLSEQAVRNSINVSRISETELIEIKVRNTDKNLASQIANEIAEVFSEKIEEIYNISNVYIIDRAVPAEAPYNINHIKDFGISISIAIIISIGYILIIHLLDNTIKNENEIEKVIGLKNLINIPLEKDKKKKQSELITYQDSKSIVSEAFRTLRTNVQFSNTNAKEGKTFLVSSCFPSEGKSYVSANLAITFAQVGKKVILVDADMRRGRQSKVFKIPNRIGLSNYISNLDENGLEINFELSKFIYETSIPNLNLITAGTVPPNPAELLASNKFSNLIEELKKYYDIIIFDGAPIIPITDSLILARMLESTILVALYNKTKKEDLLKVKNDVQAVGGKIIGTCINCVPISPSKKNSRYYYYKEDSSEKKDVQFRNIFSKLYSLVNLKLKKFISNIKKVVVKNKIQRLPASKPKIVSVEIKAKNSNFDSSKEIIEQKDDRQKEKKKQNCKEENKKAKENIEEIEKQIDKKQVKDKKQQIDNIDNKEEIEGKTEIKNELKINKQQENINQLENNNLSTKTEELEILNKTELKEKKQEAKKRNTTVKILKVYLNKVKINTTQNLEKIKGKVKYFYQTSKENYNIFLEKQAKKKIENTENKEKSSEEKRLQKEELKKIREAHLEEQRKIKEEKQEKLKQEKEEHRKQKEIEQEKLKQQKEEHKKQKEIEQEKLRQEKEEYKKQKEIEQEKLKQEKEEEREKEKEEAKLTDEYIEENLYPKTKNTKLY